MPTHLARTPFLSAAIALSVAPHVALHAQTATVPANYHGPTVTGFCFYTQPTIQAGASRTAAPQPGIVSYAGPITISNYFRFDAERAFRQYAATHAPTAQNITCRWATQQQFAAATDKSFHATDGSGHPVRAVQTGWQYTPGSGGMTASTTAATPQASPARTSGASATSTGTTSGTPTPAGSISQSVNDSRQAITSSGASAVTDTMGAATTSLTTAMQGGVGRLFHKKQADSDAPSPAAPAQADLAANPASNLLPSANDTSPGSATIAAPADGSGAPSFVFCQLKAGASIYVSDIFPSTDASDSGAQMAFWKQVGHQYKLASIPFRGNVTCARSADESQGIAARKSLLATTGNTIDTGWTYMGDPAR